MQARRLTEAPDAPCVHWLLAFSTGDRVMLELESFARRQNVGAGSFHGIGAFREATLAYYDIATREYEPIAVSEQTEVTSIVGNVGRYDDLPKIHAHATLSRRDGSTVGGHLVRAEVRPTLELFLVAYPSELHRFDDEASGLPLLVGPNG